MSKTHQFSACSKSEVMLLLDLAREHEPHVRLDFREYGDVLQIYLETDSPELSAYLNFMLARLRDRQGALASRFALSAEARA
jgi:hypothetical protein